MTGPEGAPQGQGPEGSRPQIVERVRTGKLIDGENRTSQAIRAAMVTGGGRVPYSQFMDISLFGPDGYYSQGKADIRREGGDFPTWAMKEPFNASVGTSILKVWEAMGQPDTFTILEPGAGMGKMAKDMLVWARENHPDFYNAIDYVIQDYEGMHAQQRETIAQDLHTSVLRPRQTSEEDNLRDLAKVRWVSEEELPEVEGVIISNEVPDALAQDVVRKNVEGQNQQKYVTEENNEWVEVWDAPTSEVADYLERNDIVLHPDRMEEPVNLNAEKWQRTIDNALKKGAIITIDYGRNGPVGDMSEERNAMRVFPQVERRQVPFREYSSPGDFDITANVNFAALERVAREDGLDVAFSDDQFEFLFRNGFLQNYQAAMQGVMDTGSLSGIMDAYRRVHRDRKGVERQGFHVQALTKGVTVDFGERPAHTSLVPVLDTGLKLNLGRPNTDITAVREDQYGDTFTFRTRLDGDGNLEFYHTNINPVEVFDPANKWTIQAGEDVVLDTRDRFALQRVVEESGYDYDLPDAA